MVLDDSEVAKIAMLARLGVSKEELPLYASQLTGIFDLVAQMDSADTDNIAPMAHPQDLTQRLRADEVSEIVDREKNQASASVVENGLYLVPRVIE